MTADEWLKRLSEAEDEEYLARFGDMEVPAFCPPVDVLTTTQAASLIGVNVKRIRDFANAGRLRGYQVTGRNGLAEWRFKRADVLQFDAKRRRPIGGQKDGRPRKGTAAA